MEKKYVSKTPIFNNESCPEAIKNSHAIDNGFVGELIVHSGKLEFIYEDSEQKIIVDPTSSLEIKPLKKHHVNLLWPVEFQIKFYETKNN